MAKETNKPTKESLFEAALKFEIPQEKIEVIKDSGRPLSYISWAYAWGMFKQIYPDAVYRIIKNENGLPYFSDPKVGIMVYTEITANGETHEMWLFVMNSSNKAMRFEPYNYTKWSKKYNRWEESGVEAATMFDINKTLMRCLVKNMAMFGFGLNIYNGDDLPEFDLDLGNNPEENKKTSRSKKNLPATPAAPVMAPVIAQPVAAPKSQIPTLEILPNDKYEAIKKMLNNLKTIDQMMELYQQHKDEVESNPEIKGLFGLRKKQITNQIA